MIIKSFRSIVQKDMKIFFRSKISSAIIILMPLLIILFTGLAFNSSSLNDVTISTYSEDYAQLTQTILTNLETQGYIIDKSNSNLSCIDSVKLTKSQICIIFSKDLTNTKTNQDITFHIDYSRINLAYTLIHEIENNIITESKNLGTNRAQELINSIEELKQEIPKIKSKIISAKNSLDQDIEISISTTQINQAKTELSNLKHQVNDSNTISKLEQTINLLETIKTNTEQTKEQIETFVENKDQTIIDLETVSNNLEEVIESLNNQQINSANSIVSPINVKIESIKIEAKNKDYLIPTIIALIALFGSILLSSTLVLKEKKTKAYFRNFMTPTKDITFILATYFSSLIIIVLQFILVFMGIKFILNTTLNVPLLELTTILFLIISVFILMGMFIGYIFKSEETTIFASVLISAITLFFSNVIIPLEKITSTFRELANLNPLVISDNVLKKILLFGFSFNSYIHEIIILLIYLFVFLILTFFARKITKRNL